MELSKLFELNDIAKKDASFYNKKRFIYKFFKTPQKERIFTCLIGPRGVGKTILLRQLAAERSDSFYLSMDTVNNESLFDLIKILNERYKINYFFIDEIHFLRKYDAELKKIFDFLKVNVVFTSSVSLSLYESSYDLSRRVKIIKIYPFSFREFLYFKKDVFLSALSLKDIFEDRYSEEYLKYEYFFEEYLKGGVFPFYFENKDIIESLKNVCDKIIKKDIAFFANLKMEEIYEMEKMFNFMALSQVEDLNYSSLSKNLGITKYKVIRYVDLLEKSFLVNKILPYGTNVLKEPKILITPPYRLIYKNYLECVGALREDFVVESLKIAEYDLFYLKSKRGEKTPDFFVTENNERFVIEVGGKGKGRSQFKNFSNYKKIMFYHGDWVKDENKKPMFLLGYLK
ncbi:MAG: ATP-binding protein [Elusimicrobiales bacterium]